MDGTVTDAHAFHVLTAYVQYEIHSRQELLGSLIVGHGLNETVIHPESGHDKSLAVACD